MNLKNKIMSKGQTGGSEYIVCFYQQVEDEGQIIRNGDMRLVNETQMFKWIERAHDEGLKISIYTATMKCDLS